MLRTDDCEFETKPGRRGRERHFESVAGHIRFVDVAHYVDLRLFACHRHIRAFSCIVHRALILYSAVSALLNVHSTQITLAEF